MNKGRSNQSLCENSMKMVANIVKLSSFSIAKTSLGTTAPSPATANLAPSTGSVKVVNDPPMPQFPGNRRSQELHGSSKPLSYLVEPVEGNGSVGSVKVVNDPPMPQFPGNRRSQELHSSSKPVSYRVEPVKGNGSVVVIGKEKCIDGKASDYINKVHQKIRNDLNEAPTVSPYILPPRHL